MRLRQSFLRRPLALAIGATLVLAACGGGSDQLGTPQSTSSALTIPPAPADPGFVDAAPVVASAPAFIDNVASNQRGDARYATLETNAGVRLLAGFKAIWQPLTDLVDAGVTAPAVGNFPAIVPSTWTGIPNDGTPGGTVLNTAVHSANIQYVVTATSNRTSAQATAAYLDDRRGKGYSVTDGMGPLTTAWRQAAQQTTSITTVPADATTVLYNDSGNNTGVGGNANPAFGGVVDFINAMGNNGSTEPAKRFYKYARPFRWSSSVAVVPALVPAESSTPATDGGFTSGHSAEATRDAVAMAYAVPERFQEIISRGLELGENRILAGMHSPLDVMSGRVLAQAVVAANLTDPANATVKATAVAQAHTALMAQTNTTPDTFNAFAHSVSATADRFADHATNKANYLRRMTYGFTQIAAATTPAVVPKGAEVLLETRLPYLSDVQRRVVLKTTAIASGYPVLDDPEGWGRLNLFAAADGYAAFNGNVVVSMDASKGGFYAIDTWRNDISGAGKLTKQGSGVLKLSGNNTWSGGTQLEGGTLEGDSVSAFGAGDVYVAGGTLASNASGALSILGKYTQLPSSTLELNLGNGQQGALAAVGNITIAGGTLHIKFQGGYKPAVGATITVITAANFKGKFDTISVDGFSAIPLYSNTGLQLRIAT
ncbi:phosphatase PAP2 family protein [Collimonas pratensis]|uniref:acid phosphatase n=1 Tax=Collimonas pratensis TaxID=279113 RepID=UPI00143D5D66|nr:phosphatase PAP2 family protein [Collimonas pratensis]NKI69318.1 phosphatase PAP2 family protein [Collimonas pratensis]